MPSMPVRGETPGLPAVEGLVGLTSAEAAERLTRYGPNLVPERRPHLVRALFARFWAPVPWMLEITVALELVLDRRLEAVVIAVLLAFNAVVGFVQERRASNAVALLRRRLAIQARVLRDGRWTLLPAQELAPGDVVHLRMGDIAPADVSVETGAILMDQSTLTGESIPVEVGAKQTAYAGAIIKRGEATGEVAATGAQTLFGKTAELMRTAESRSHLQAVILTIVKYLMALDALAIAAVVAYSLAVGLPLKEVIPFVLILLLASIPVALPATFTLATALGALELGGRGVLVTRLSAIEEAAGMDVLCTDKTGTITKNELSVAAITAYAPYAEDQLLRLRIRSIWPCFGRRRVAACRPKRSTGRSSSPSTPPTSARKPCFWTAKRKRAS
jgi:H+-transporting ATPase